MKKLVLLFISILTIGFAFQSCDNSKTYAEMLEDERNAVDDFIKAHNIKVISVEDFEADTITNVNENEYVGFSNGVYMQIVKRFGKPRGETKDYESLEAAPAFADGNLILARFCEVDILTNDTTLASNVHNKYEYLNVYPDGFRYTVKNTSIYGQFVAESGLAYYFGYGMGGVYGPDVPAGWLMALQYVKDGAHVKLIVPSKSGHTTAQQYVYPYYYDIEEFTIY